jgi:hypothetical protein
VSDELCSKAVGGLIMMLTKYESFALYCEILFSPSGFIFLLGLLLWHLLGQLV